MWGDRQEQGRVSTQVGPEAKGGGEMAQSPGGAEGWNLGPQGLGEEGEGSLTREQKPPSLIRAGGGAAEGEQMASSGPFTGADTHQLWF